MVSIIVPTYNSMKYIEAALNSLFEQTYKDIEIIVIDDGSTDDTEEILSKYKDRIRYFRKENGGEASARNFGIEIARGEYIAFLDSDDLYKIDKIEKQLSILRSQDVDVVYNDVEVVDENLELIKVLKSEEVYENPYDLLCMMLYRQIVPAPASIMLKSHCVKNGIKYPEDYRNAEDYSFTIQLASKFKFGYIPESLYVYRRHGENLTNDHENQVKSEVEIVKNLGKDNIENIVNSATFDIDDKKIILSKIFIKIGEWELAKDILDKLSERLDNKCVWFYLGNCHYNLKEYYKARVCYKNAIKIDNTMAEAYNNLGCTFGKIGDINNASHSFKTAKLLREEYMDAEYNLTHCDAYSEFINYKLTVRELRKVLTNYK